MLRSGAVQVPESLIAALLAMALALAITGMPKPARGLVGGVPAAVAP